MQSVFVCGCGHSGTSLIANILAGHSDIHIPLYETGIFLNGADSARVEFARLRDETVRTRKRVLVEKTPRHICHLDLVRQVVGDPLFVVPVRDGRDVAASIAVRTGSLNAGIDRWIDETGIALKARDAPDILCYRHEDLVDDPAGVVERICRFIHVPFLPALLQFHETRRLWFLQTEIRKGSGIEGDEHMALRNWQINQPIFDNRGRWRSEWDAADMRELTEGRGRGIMIGWGYLQASDESRVAGETWDPGRQEHHPPCGA